MNKLISPKIVSVTFGILVLLFVVGFYIFAWQEPSEAPPGGNVPAPLNTGPIGQSKEGGLILNTGDAENGLIIDKGKLCLGTDCISSWSQAGTGVVTTYRMSAVSTATAEVKTYDCPEGTEAVQTYCKSAPYRCDNNILAEGCSCSVSGRTATLTAYVLRSVNPCECVAPCCPAVGAVNNCSVAGLSCGGACTPSSCEMEFQCGIKTEVGL